MSEPRVDAVWEDPERVEEFARKPPDHRLQALVEAEPDPRSLRALDVGCAGGRNAVFLAEHGVDVMATDASAAMVERTRERLAAIVGPEEAARRVVRSTMEVAPGVVDASVDLVVALGIYHNARSAGEWQAALGETARVLRPGGRALVSVFTPETDLDGQGQTPVPGVTHLYERSDGRRMYLVDPATLDREMATHGLEPVEPTVLAEGKVEVGRRVSVNGLYRKPDHRRLRRHRPADRSREAAGVDRDDPGLRHHRGAHRHRDRRAGPCPPNADHHGGLPGLWIRGPRQRRRFLQVLRCTSLRAIVKHPARGEHVLKLGALVLGGAFTFGLPARGAEAELREPAVSGPVEDDAGLAGQVFDARTGDPLPARVVVRDTSGEVVATRYAHLPGVFTAEDGTFALDLAPGAYSLEVLHGIDYVPQTRNLLVREGGRVEVRIDLEPWVPLRALGWVNGDAHAHLYTERERDDSMLETVRQICRAQGVDFLAVCQGWAGYGDDDWRAGYARFSDDRFWFHYGAEMPKYRTGHTFWFGLASTRGYYAASMDETYENEYYQVARNPEWSFETLPFPSIPDVELVPRLKEAEGAVALVPHPTSWWWQKRDGVEKYTTNVAAHLAFGLLSGGLWDGLVVMGYDHDHYFYQNLWFHTLNEGYRLTPVAELDGGFEPGTSFPYGAMRTYLHVGADRTMESIVRAVKAGHTFTTSGPIVLASVDGRYQVGDVIPADGTARTLRVQAFASGDPQDHLTYLILFRNGRIHRLWDLRDERPRKLEEEVILRETARAWYVVKAYGGNSDRPPEALDVMAVCDRIAEGNEGIALRKESDVCLTSPFYFRPKGVGDPPALRSRVRLTAVDPETEAPVGTGRVRVRFLGRALGTHLLTDGRVELTMPVNAILELDVPGYPALRRSLYIDYVPYRDLLERLATGRWLDEHGGHDRMQPGQVPWEAFHLDEARELLSEVDWRIKLSPNERDGLWARFEGLLR